MNAQKLKNNKITIGSSCPRKDAIEVIENLRVAEFYRLVRASRNWDKSLNDKRDIIFTSYADDKAKVVKEFNLILEKRKLHEERLATYTQPTLEIQEMPVVKEEHVEKIEQPPMYRSSTIGTSKLIRISKRQLIKIVRRKGRSDNFNKINSVCIPNNLREEFFKDCKQTNYFSITKLYEIANSEEDKEIYDKWDKIVTKIYEEGLNKF